MHRRGFLVGLSVTATGASAAISSGAFSKVSAERSVSIAVSDDANAFLRLKERGSGERSEVDGGILEFGIPGDDEADHPDGNPTDPDGVGTDSVYRFGADAAHDEPGLFGVENHGTKPVGVYSTQEETNGVPSVNMYDVDSGDLLTESNPSDPIAVGEETLVCGLEIDTHGVAIQDNEYEVILTINAVATND